MNFRCDLCAEELVFVSAIDQTLVCMIVIKVCFSITLRLIRVPRISIDYTISLHLSITPYFRFVVANLKDPLQLLKQILLFEAFS